MNDQQPATVGGYRVVRKLGEGPRAEIFLGYPVREGSEETPAALKIYREYVDQPAIVREIDALSKAAGPHVVGLRDVSFGASRALVLDRLARGGLSRLLSGRDRLQVGEAITILVPLLEAVSRMHRAGCVHGSVGSERVLFTSDGAPVLVGFGRSAPMEAGLAPARLAENEGVLGDLNALAALSGSVLARLADGRGMQLAEWASGSSVRDSDGWCAQFTARLFDLGDAAPIEFDRDPTIPIPAVGRLVAPVTIDGDPEAGAVAARLGLDVPDWLDPLLSRARAHPLLARFRAAVRVVRPAVWGAAAAVAVALTAAVAFVPSDSGTAAHNATPAATSDPQATPSDDPSGSAVMGGDPVAAAVVLLETRERCFRELSVICLDAVAQQGSGALSADQSAMRDAQNGAELSPGRVPDATQLTVVEEAGDAVLLEWSDAPENTPASLLLMKGEAGWRIRDYLSQ